MMRSAQTVLPALMLMICGCATRGNVELLESQLRQQEDQLYALRAERDQAKSELQIAQREAQSLRSQLAEQGKESLLPEQAQTLYRVTGVRVNEWFSGGLDRDGNAGDDLLNVMLIPHDEHGETLKLPGRVELEVLDLSAPESSRKLGVWTFDSEQVADSWQSGLTSGFQFRLPLKTPPTSNNIFVHARFATLDGRQFQTTADLHVIPSDVQYAGSVPAPSSGATVRTAVKPISSRPEPRERSRTTENINEFFPVAVPSTSDSDDPRPDRNEDDFFPEPSNTRLQQMPAPAPPADDWGWKPLEPADAKTPSGQTSSDWPNEFSTIPEGSPTTSLERNDASTGQQTPTEAMWSNLPASESGERKPF